MASVSIRSSKQQELNESMKVSLTADELIGTKQVRQLVRDFRNFFGVRFQDKGHLTRTI